MQHVRVHSCSCAHQKKRMKKRMTDDIYFLAITPPMQQVAEVGHWQRSATAVSWWPSTVLKDVKLENLERLQMASDGFRWLQMASSFVCRTAKASEPPPAGRSHQASPLAECPSQAEARRPGIGGGHTVGVEIS